MKIKSLGLKISLLVTCLIVITCGIIYFIVAGETDNLIKELNENEARSANRAFATGLMEDQNAAYVRALLATRDKDVVDSILNKDYVELRRIMDDFMEGMDIITICDANGIVMARGHSDKTGDSIYNQNGVANVLTTGNGTSTIENGALIGLSIRGSCAIKDSEGNIIGAIICGNDLSQAKYVDEMKNRYNCEVTIFDGDTRLSTTLLDETGQRVIGTKATDAVIKAVLEQQQDYALQIDLFGSSYSAYYSPLIRDNNVLGMLFVGINIDDILAKQRFMLNRVLSIAAVSGIASVILAFIYMLLFVSKPLKKIGAFAEKIRCGDLGISSASVSSIDVRSYDEVGLLARSLEQAYAQLKGYINEIKERMQGLSEGDLITKSTYDFQGDFILIKDAVNGIVNNLNQTMREVDSSTSQVSVGAKQIADGAQALAQGSTEQAASVQQLSSAISEIAHKTKANAHMAGRAASLATTIMNNAQTGSRQMDEMMIAVQEINQASQSISKVIKVIDDIAFQTNILALNAAVEAARAGQHGKGFAVVAEEVRNLAAKSAGAAKETGDMIQNSMQKAELGAKIAAETSASLMEIVSGITESTQIVQEIAQSSEKQSLDIDHINTGIDQVAQVVQQNSATAEESAAASQEMSGQSGMLEQLISQFKLSHKSTSNF
ncbi:MAG: methyl-accepting chemotaxis protein [Clostridiales bacterium]|nr:methyl-accepting chemotaxis protein [Clostridiales bacterium]